MTTDVITTPTDANPDVAPVAPVTTPAATDTQDTPEQIAAKLAEQQVELTKNAALIDKLRRFEKENKIAAQKAQEAAEAAAKEQGKYQELYEAEQARRTALESKVKETAISAVLERELTEAGALSIPTVSKLIDKSAIVMGEDFAVDAASVKQVIESLKKSDPILFKQAAAENEKTPITPAVKKATDAETVTGYEAEVKAAKTAKELQAVLKKYGKV